MGVAAVAAVLGLQFDSYYVEESRGWPAPQMDLNFKSCPSGKQSQSPCSGPPPGYQELSTDYDWLVKSIGHSGQREIRKAFPVIC